MAKAGAKGALAYRPGQYDLSQDQRMRFDQLKADKGRKAARKYLARQDKQGNLAAKGTGAGPDDTGIEPVPNDFENSQTAINQGIYGQMQNLNSREAFKPNQLPNIPGVADGFDASMQKYGDSIYSEFERRQEPQMQREQEAFRQRMYDQGVPEGSEKFKQLQQEMTQGQNDARLSAKNQAAQAGMQYQNQAFGQGLSANQNAYGQQADTYRMPFEQLAAYSPYYQTGASRQNLQDQFRFQNEQRLGTQDFTAGQSQADFERQKALQRLQHQYNMQLPRGGGGGGPESFAQWQQKQDYLDNQWWDRQIMSGGSQQMPSSGFGSGFGQGFGAGVGAGITGAVLS
jgi:hypothetical protein